MTVYILEPVSVSDGTPWKPWYDCMFKCVVRANSEHEARTMATKAGGAEVRKDPMAWFQPHLSTCKDITYFGEPGVIIRDIHAA